MTEATAEQLDLSRLPPFTLVPADFEAGMAARKASLVARYAAMGIPFNTENLETDPVIIPQQEDEHRRLLDIQALNDTAQGLTVSYGWGDRLDHIAATLLPDIGIRRMPLVFEPRPYATNPEDWEDDNRFRRRINLAHETRSPFTAGAYVFAALSASVEVGDAVALNWASGVGLAPGELRLVILGNAGSDEDALVTAVSAALAARHIKALSDVVTVVKARRVTVPLEAKLRVRRGPDPALVLAEAQRRLALHLLDRRRIGNVLANSGLDASLHVGGVEEVVLNFASVDPGPDGVVHLSPVSVTTEVAGG